MSFISDLDNLGLKNMVKYKGHWSEEVIRACYTNLEYKVRDRTIVSEVRGKKIMIDEKQLLFWVSLYRPFVSLTTTIP